VSNIEWLLREAIEDFSMPTTPRFVADDEYWCATIERISLAPTLHVFLNDVSPRRDLRIGPMREVDRHVVGQVLLEGCVDIDFAHGAKARATRETSILYSASTESSVYMLKAGVRFHSAGYSLDPGRVERLFDGELPPVLHPLIHSRSGDERFIAAGSNSAMRNAAMALFAPGLNGPLRRLFMEGIVLQLLAVQSASAASHAMSRQQRDVLAPRERAAIHEARDRLLADMRCPPAISELADAVGLSERRLGIGFRLEFGATPFEILRDRRLEHARQALEQEALPLKEIAFRVGYNHVSNFIHAFRARYGAPPRQFLRPADGTVGS